MCFVKVKIVIKMKKNPNRRWKKDIAIQKIYIDINIILKKKLKWKLLMCVQMLVNWIEYKWWCSFLKASKVLTFHLHTFYG